jgi:hypothetical protein
MALESEKVWSRPELTVIVRGKPAEAVLVACKSNDLKVYGSVTNYFYCTIENCNPQCSAQVYS